MKTKLQLESFFSLATTLTEESCINYLKEIRWNGTPSCPCCNNSEKIYTYSDSKTYCCSKCNKQFTVISGTIFHSTKLPLRKWFLAIYLFGSQKKGISSYQLARLIKITQPNAYKLAHKIRCVMSNSKMFEGKLSGEVEIDESFVGGRNHNRHYDKKVKNSQGRSTKDKSAVLGMLERDGRVFLWVLKRLHKRGMQALIKAKVKEDSFIATDEYKNYRGLNKYFNHGVVNHGKHNWRNGFAHTNGMENFWSWLKKGITGIYHRVTKRHLLRYCREIAYRFNTREFSEEARFIDLISECFRGRFIWKGLYLS